MGEGDERVWGRGVVREGGVGDLSKGVGGSLKRGGGSLKKGGGCPYHWVTWVGGCPYHWVTWVVRWCAGDGPNSVFLSCFHVGPE